MKTKNCVPMLCFVLFVALVIFDQGSTVVVPAISAIGEKSGVLYAEIFPEKNEVTLPEKPTQKPTRQPLGIASLDAPK